MIPNEGERRILQARKEIGSQRVILFKNDVTVDDEVTWASLEECDFSGYERGLPAWGDIATGLDGRAVMLADALTWLHDGGDTMNDVYGAALIDGNPGLECILSIVKFGSPRSMNGIGDFITVTPSSFDRQQE